MLNQAPPPRRAPWFFSEVAGITLDVLGQAVRWDEVVALPGLFVYVSDGRAEQLAIIDGAIPVEEARTLIEQRPSLDDLASAMSRHMAGRSDVSAG
jgi:hypothetical protein